MPRALRRYLLHGGALQLSPQRPTGRRRLLHFGAPWCLEICLQTKVRWARLSKMPGVSQQTPVRPRQCPAATAAHPKAPRVKQCSTGRILLASGTWRSKLEACSSFITMTCSSSRCLCFRKFPHAQDETSHVSSMRFPKNMGHLGGCPPWKLKSLQAGLSEPDSDSH